MAPSIPLLRVLTGPSTSELVDISDLVNTGESHSIESDRFSGSIAVYIKGFPGAPKSEYFNQEERKNVTWSIQTQGEKASSKTIHTMLRICDFSFRPILAHIFFG